MDDSDNELMPLAFPVSGELAPGRPPTNGEEYLMQVRWEAKRCQSVVVSNVDPRKYDNNISNYWKPPKCSSPPPGLEPSPAWEEEFLADFQELREEIERIHKEEKERFEIPKETLPSIEDADEWYYFCFGKGKKRKPHLPLMSFILQLQPVDISQLLEYHIEWLEDSLNELQGQWLFALLVRLDKPLDPDIAASLRVLNRKSCQIRSKLVLSIYSVHSINFFFFLKTRKEEKLVASITIIITLVEKYFGQKDLN